MLCRLMVKLFSAGLPIASKKPDIEAGVCCLMLLQARQLAVAPRCSRGPCRQPLRPMGIGFVFMWLIHVLMLLRSACGSGSMPCPSGMMMDVPTKAQCLNLGPLKLARPSHDVLVGASFGAGSF